MTEEMLDDLLELVEAQATSKDSDWVGDSIRVMELRDDFIAKYINNEENKK